MADPSAYGVVALNDQGRVARFQEKPGPGQAFSRLANTGIYCVEPQVLERVPRGRACDWSREVFPRMLAEGRPLFGEVLDGYWCDVGSIDEYRRGQWDALKGTVRVGLPAVAVSAGVWFGADAWVAPGAVTQGPVLLGAGCRIERDAWVLPGRPTVGPRCSAIGRWCGPAPASAERSWARAAGSDEAPWCATACWTTASGSGRPARSPRGLWSVAVVDSARERGWVTGSVWSPHSGWMRSRSRS